VLAVPALGPVLLLWRYDLAPAVLHLAAAVYALRGRRDLSWLLLGVGVALKPYLLVVVPLWLLWDRRPSRLLLALAPSLVSALVMTALIGTEWVDAYAFQGSRELSVEAGPAVVAGVFGIGSVGLDRACLCFVRVGADSFGVAGSALCVAALGTVYWRFRDRPVEGSLAAVAVVLLFAPVFSPQYLVWLLPVAALVGGRTLALAAAAAFTGFLAYPLLYDEVLAGDAFPLLIVRLLLLAALVPFPPQGGEKHPAAPYGVHEQQSGAG
jgi:hypothetical protein